MLYRETLLKSCWHRTPSLRPQAAEVVELLTNNTRLIQPCVGIPLSSIQIEGVFILYVTNKKTILLTNIFIKLYF